MGFLLNCYQGLIRECLLKDDVQSSHSISGFLIALDLCVFQYELKVLKHTLLPKFTALVSFPFIIAVPDRL